MRAFKTTYGSHEMNSRTKQFFQQAFLETEDSESMFVCQQCLGDSLLRRLGAGLQAERVCAVCGLPTRNALTAERIALFIRKDLPLHFSVDDGRYPGYELTLTAVVSRAIRCSNPAVCEAVAEHLVDASVSEDDFYWPGQEYCPARSPFDSQEHERWYIEGEWYNIAHDLAHGRRFFNDNARKFFDSLIFEALHAESAEHPGTPVVIKILPPDSSFYRARIANGMLEARSFKKIPPIRLARRLGNPQPTTE